MKYILFLFSLVPYLASAQVAKDTVTVLTTAEIQAGQASDTANFYFIQNGQWRKINMDSLDSFLRRKRAGDRGDIDVSTDGLTWTVDTNAVGAISIAAGAVDSTKLAAGAVVLPGAKVTGTLPVSKGGTGSATQNFVDLTTAQTVAGAKTFTSDITLIASGFQPFILRRPIALVGFSLELPFFLQNAASSYINYAALRGVIRDTTIGSEDGELQFHTMTNSAQTEKARVTSNGEMWIGYTADQGAYLLQVNSQIFATNATIATSDVRYKENVTPLGGTLEKIMQLKPVSFTFIPDSENNFSEFEEVGFIAQEVEDALSTETYSRSIVKPLNETDDKSPLGLSETKMIPLLVKAIQEQQAQIEQLKNRISQLENK